MSRRTLIIVGALVLAVGAWVLSFRQLDKKWQTKPLAPTKRAAARPAQPLNLQAVTASGKTVAEVWAEFQKNGAPKLTPAQINDYVDSCGRDAQSLIVAARLSGDLEFLQEAALAYPENPLVQLEVALSPSATPEERRAALEAFKAVSPDNALGDYLSAHLSFTEGKYGEAANGLLASLDHGTLADFSEQIMAGTEQAYLSAGQDPLSAQFAAMAGLTRPTLAPMREVSRHLDSLKDEFIKADDFDAAHPTVLVGLDLGQKMQSQAPYLIDQLLGMSIERSFLEQLDPLTTTGGNGQTAGERLAELETKKTDIAATASSFNEAWMKMDATSSREYFKRVRRDGEFSAMKWVLAR
ncbi:MAG: hypothetical protein WCP67_09925 [Verrucomicrobiota bacterium]